MKTKTKIPWYLYVTRTVLAGWLVYLIYIFQETVGQMPTVTGPFTWWDVGGALAAFTLTAWLGWAAGAEHLNVQDYRAVKEKNGLIGAQIVLTDDNGPTGENLRVIGTQKDFAFVQEEFGDNLIHLIPVSALSDEPDTN